MTKSVMAPYPCINPNIPLYPDRYTLLNVANTIIETEKTRPTIEINSPSSIVPDILPPLRLLFSNRLLIIWSWRAWVTSSLFSKLISHPSNTSTGVSRIWDILMSISPSGIDNPFSHLEIVCRTTFNSLARNSCESPFSFRMVFKLSLNTRAFSS